MRILLSFLLLAFVSCKKEDKDALIMEETREDITRLKIISVEKAVQTYIIKNDGVPPESLADVSRYIDGDANDKFTDAWGNEFKYDAKGPKHDGKKPDIWTETPKKKITGNWGSN